MASYCQESTRYCNYSKDVFGSEITVIRPSFLTEGTPGWQYWKVACRMAEKSYFELLDWGCTPQEARAVLATCLKVEVVMTANLREWRHFFKAADRPGGARRCVRWPSRCSTRCAPRCRSSSMILRRPPMKLCDRCPRLALAC